MGHKGVKGQIFKNAPIELKFLYNDFLWHSKHRIFYSRSLRSHKGVKGQIFKNVPIELELL